MESDLISLVYVSHAAKAFSKPDLVDLLIQSRKNNGSLGITGMLLFKDGNFLQVLEGNRIKVHDLYKKIMLDPRHNKFAALFEGVAKERDFPDWSMGFQDLNAPEIAGDPGFTNFLKTSLTAADFSSDPSRAKKMLLLFKDDKLLQAKAAKAR